MKKLAVLAFVAVLISMFLVPVAMGKEGPISPVSPVFVPEEEALRQEREAKGAGPAKVGREVAASQSSDDKPFLVIDEILLGWLQAGSGRD